MAPAPPARLLLPLKLSKGTTSRAEQREQSQELEPHSVTPVEAELESGRKGDGTYTIIIAAMMFRLHASDPAEVHQAEVVADGQILRSVAFHSVDSIRHVRR